MLQTVSYDIDRDHGDHGMPFPWTVSAWLPGIPTSLGLRCPLNRVLDCTRFIFDGCSGDVGFFLIGSLQLETAMILCHITKRRQSFRKETCLRAFAMIRTTIVDVQLLKGRDMVS